MNVVHLHGALGEQFGSTHRYLVDTPCEAVRALIANKPGFKDALSAMEVRLIRSKPDAEDGLALDIDMIGIGMQNGDLHIIPVAAGSKQEGGIGKIVLGVVLVAAVIITAGGASPFAAGAWGAGGAYAGLAGNVLLGGFAMALGGVAMLLAPTPKTNDTEQKASFLFNGVKNVTEQGAAVPLVYGLILTGSVVGSVSIQDEQIGVARGGSFNGIDGVSRGLGAGLFSTEMWDGYTVNGSFTGGYVGNPFGGFPGSYVITDVEGEIQVRTHLELD